MATVRLYLDTRRKLASGQFPIRLAIRHRKTFLIATGYATIPETWDGAGLTRKAANYKARNAALHKMLNDIETLLIQLGAQGRLRSMADNTLKTEVAKILGKTSIGSNFIETLNEYIKRLTNEGTKTIYKTTRNKIIAYDPKCTFDSMDVRWMEGLERHMAETMKINAYAIHLRNIRTVFNFAIDEGITTAYPFRKFRIKHEETRKRSLTVEQLRALRDFKCEPHQEKYRDMFMLMFYLIGINAADLFRADKEQLKYGRLEYKRAKTGKLYSIKAEPEAMAIINRYRGSGKLLNIGEGYDDYKDFLHRMDVELKRIGEVKRIGRGGRKVRSPAFSGLSSYWARHTWATIAASIDVPVDTISAALGHAHGSSTTAIYIKLDERKVDEANRKVIDYVHAECTKPPQ